MYIILLSKSLYIYIIEEIKFHFIEDIMNVMYAMKFITNPLNVIDVHFYVVLNVLIISFSLLMIVVQFADIKK